MDPWKNPAAAELGEAADSPFIGEILETSAGIWPTKATQRWGDFESPFVARTEHYQGLDAELDTQVEEDEAEAPTLRGGSRGPAVRRLQSALVAAGHLVDVDGDFGAQTQSAVWALQSRAGLVVDGVVGPATWRRLADVSPSVSAAGAPGPPTQSVGVPPMPMPVPALIPEAEEREWLAPDDEEPEGVPHDEEPEGVLNAAPAVSAAETTELMLTEAAFSGQLLLDPSTPAAPSAWPGDLLVTEATGTQLLEEHQAPAVAVTRVAVSVRTDFTVRTATGTRFDWAHGEAVRGARAEIVGTGVSAVSDANGDLRLDTTGLRDGFHTIRIEHTGANQSFPDLAGPALADPLPTLPRRIYRPLNVWVGMRGGQITGAMVALFSPHGSIGNRSRAAFDATHLPIDWKPVWMQSPVKAGEGPRATTTIDLVVVHRPDRSDIGPAINTFLNGAEVGNAHYLIDHNGHVIKMAEDRRRANHAGYSRWRGNAQLNGASIGIEVMRAPNRFTAMAMAALTALIERLRAAYTTIPSHRIVGHSDIATSKTHPTLLSNRRLDDPGHQFDWPVLERRGLGMVPGVVGVGNGYAGIFAPGQRAVVLREGDYDRFPVMYGMAPGRLGGVTRADVLGGPIAELQADLEHIGYSVRPPGGRLGWFDAHTVAAVDRFQRHFFSGSRENLRPALGRVDVLTAGWIRAVQSTIPP